jgi:hypothetical protein
MVSSYIPIWPWLSALYFIRKHRLCLSNKERLYSLSLMWDCFLRIYPNIPVSLCVSDAAQTFPSISWMYIHGQGVHPVLFVCLFCHSDFIVLAQMVWQTDRRRGAGWVCSAQHAMPRQTSEGSVLVRPLTLPQSALLVTVRGDKPGQLNL